MKNKKLKATLSITGYLLLLLAICFAGVFVFHAYYYEPVYVSGASMYPTLNGDDDEHVGAIVDFGIVDAHKSAIDHIKRFDIVSTYFPNTPKYGYDYDEDGSLRLSATKKIKRVIAMPNETFKIENGILSIKQGDDFKVVPYTFKIDLTINPTVKDTTDPITLQDDEYWLLGDNRANSTDCFSIGKPVQKKNINGVLVAIEGKASLALKRQYCSNCGKTFTAKNHCSCGAEILQEYGLKNKQYHWPKFF